MAACVASCSVSIYVPGSLALISASWGTSIGSLVYLYKGYFPSLKEISDIIKLFPLAGGASVGMLTYIGFVSLLPPNGILDTAGL